MLNIRYQFKIWKNTPYFMNFWIEWVENWCVEFEFKKWASVISRDYWIEMFDKNNNELFINDIIKSYDWWQDNFYHIINEAGAIYLLEIVWFNFDWTLSYWTQWDISKLTSYDNIFRDTIKIWNIYEVDNIDLKLT